MSLEIDGNAWNRGLLGRRAGLTAALLSLRGRHHRALVLVERLHRGHSGAERLRSHQTGSKAAGKTRARC